MKVYRVESNMVAFDEDESMVIIAKCKNRALEIAISNWNFREGRSHMDFSIVEYDLSQEGIVDVAHYGD